MSGCRSGSTPTPPQTDSENLPPAAAMATRPDDGQASSPLSAPAVPLPPGEDPPFHESPPTPPPCSPISDTVDTPPPPGNPISDTVDAPPPALAVEQEVRSAAVQKRAECVATVAKAEGPVDSPIVESEELLLNGLPARGGDSAECDASPIAEPDVHREAPPPAVVATPAPVVKATLAQVVKETPAPVVKAMTLAQVAKETPAPVAKETPASSVADIVRATPPLAEDREDMPPPQTTPPESTMQAVSVPKKKRKMKELNKKEAGDLLDAFTEMPTPLEPEATPPVQSEPLPRPIAPPPMEETDETWEEREDALDAASLHTHTHTHTPQSSDPTTPTEQKYQYRTEHWKPLNPEEKKCYDREFLLGFQFSGPSMHKPEGLPQISDVVLDKANKPPLRQLDPARLPGMSCGPDFTPSYLGGRQPMGGGGRGPPAGMGGPRRSGQGQRKILSISSSLSDDVQLNKAEKAWQPAAKRAGPVVVEDDAEAAKTQELFRRVRSILNKLTPQMFQSLMKQVTELTIDTEERLKGVIDLIFEKAISEPNFSVAYANMCRCLMGLKVLTSSKPGVTVNFRKLLLNHCQQEFEKDQHEHEIFQEKQKELDAATGEEECQRLKEELEEAKNKARRRSLGNIKFIGELFKLKMLTEPIMHDCIVKLLKNHDDESLECLCRLLSTIGKDLDFEKAKPRMDQYFHQMEKIIKERKTSSRIRFMLQDGLDLRRSNWVSRRGDQGPKTIEQIHKDAEQEEHREHMKVQQQLLSKKEGRGGGPGGRGGFHTPGPRGNQPQDEGWNTVPISTKNRPIDTTRLSKITKPGAMDVNLQLLGPGGKSSWGSWGRGSSGGTGTAKIPESGPDSGPRTSTLNRFSALQQSSSSSSSSANTGEDRRVPHRNSASRERGDRFDRRDDRFDRRDEHNRNDERNRANERPTVGKRSFSREEERSRDRDTHTHTHAVRRVASLTDDRSSSSRARSKENVKRETAPTPPPAPSKPALSEDELEKKSTAIIEEYLHLNDMKEALQCVSELDCAASLGVFVRSGIESTLERSTQAREHLALLLHQLLKTGTLTSQQYYKGLTEILEVGEDMAIDIPHFWLYLAELIAPMLHEGGLPMGQLFREVSKPLVAMGTAGTLLAQILNLLCKGMSHKKVGALWSEAGLSWKDFLPEDEDVNKFVTEKGVEYTLGGVCEFRRSSKELLSSEELSKQLDRLIQDKADNQRINDWVEVNLNEQQTASNVFIRALMTSVCQSAIRETPYKVDGDQITQRAKLLQRYLKDEQKELQALYALQSLMVQMEQPPNLLRMLFDVLYDEDVIKEEGFYKWESSKDVAEQQGKGVALKSVTAFFTWLREAEDESDNS